MSRFFMWQKYPLFSKFKHQCTINTVLVSLENSHRPFLSWISSNWNARVLFAENIDPLLIWIVVSRSEFSVSVCAALLFSRQMKPFLGGLILLILNFCVQKCFADLQQNNPAHFFCAFLGQDFVLKIGSLLSFSVENQTGERTVSALSGSLNTVKIQNIQSLEGELDIKIFVKIFFFWWNSLLYSPKISLFNCFKRKRFWKVKVDCFFSSHEHWKTKLCTVYEFVTASGFGREC